MTMYYFDTIATDGAILRDDEGVDLLDLEAAKREASKDALAIALERGEGHERTVVKVRDGHGEIFTVSVHVRIVIEVAGSDAAPGVDNAGQSAH